MTKSWEEDETWEEDRYRRDLQPLSVRISVQPAASQVGEQARESARILLAEILELPAEKRRPRLRESRFQIPELLELLLEAGHAALPFDLDRALEMTGLICWEKTRRPKLSSGRCAGR